MRYLLSPPSLALLLTSGFSSLAIAEAPPDPIRVGVYQNQPKVFVAPNYSEPQGFWPELLGEIAAAEDWTLQYLPCEWQDCLNAVEAGELDLMLDVSYSQAREHRFDFNQQPVVPTWSVIYVRKGESLNTIIDLDGLRLGVLAEGIQHEDLKQRTEQFGISPQFLSISDYETMFALLEAGEVDAIAVNKYTGALAETEHSITPTNILVAPTQVHFVAPNGQNADLLEAIDDNLLVLKADPNSSYYQLKETWLIPEEPFSWQSYREGLMLAGGIGVGLVIISILSWNQHLRRVVQQRRVVEAALAESESWLRRVLTTAEIICWEEDLQKGKIRYYGRHGSKGWQTGQHYVDSVETLLEQAIHPDDVDAVRSARQKAIGGLGEISLEHRICITPQRCIWVLTTGQVVANEQGHPLFLVGVSINITQQKSAEQSLQTSEEQLHLALEVSKIGIWDWHVDTNGAEWNDNHYLLLGFEPGEIVPSYDTWLRGIHPEDRERAASSLTAALETQTEFVEEYRIIHTDGSVRWIASQGRCICDDSGKVTRMLGVSVDITKNKESEEALRESEATKQQVLEAIPDLLLWMGTDGVFEGIAGGEKVHNLVPPEVALGKNYHDVLPPALAELRRQAIASVQRTGQVYRYEQQLEIDGNIYFEEVRVVPIERNRVLCIIRDISDVKRAELALADRERLFRVVSENMTDLVCLHELNGQYRYVTPSCRTLLGYSQAEMVGLNPYELFHSADREVVRNAHELALKGQEVPVIYRIRHRKGHYIWLETLTKLIRDETGEIIHLQTTSRDVSDRVLMEQRLRHDALHDVLTDLPNRYMLIERIELAIKRAHQHADTQFAVLFLDFDRFKFVNDSLGHAAGDELLVNIAHRLETFLNGTDLVARLGGDEFVILLEEIPTINEAIHLAEQVLHDLRRPFFIQNQELFMTASIGIVMGTVYSTSADVLLRNADIAMYRAKANGRDRYALYDPEMHDQVLNRLQLEHDLRRAVEQQEFFLVYQPIVSLTTLKLVGFEALVRWQHPSRGTLSPGYFIEAVEDTDLIYSFGEWVMLTACQQLAEWHNRYPSLSKVTLSVNLSVKQLRESILIPQMKRVIAQTDIDPTFLTLEITESLLVKEIEETQSLLGQLQLLGVKINIDDFGTGYSSLSYLNELPVDSFKIDRSFVSSEKGQLKSKAIAKSIVGLSNLLGLKAIAEGIETQEQFEWLQSIGCEYGQGYLFAKPLTAPQAEALLQCPLNPFKLSGNLAQTSFM